MKRTILTLLAAFAFATALFAIPARPGKFVYTQPDGSTITVRIHGDEWYHYVTDESGQVVEMDAAGYYRPSVLPQFSSRMRARRIGAMQGRAAQRQRVKEAPSTNQGTRHIPVILAAFADKAFKVSSPQQAFSNMLNQNGYNTNGGTGSVNDFYVDNSHGLFNPIFDVYGPVTLPGNIKTYGTDEAARAIIEAVTELDATVDFSQYDTDGDGDVDMLLFYYAGYNQAEGGPSYTIWPHQWEISYESDPALSNNNFDGVRFNKYFTTSELQGASGSKMCGIGTTCHEFGHSLGLPDFYDTDYEENDQAAGLLCFSTMDSGSYLNDGRTPPYFSVEERVMLGWIDETAFQSFSGSGVVTIDPVENDVAYKLPHGLQGEYFSFECRAGQGWDKYLPKGLLVYHADKSSRKVTIHYQTASGSYASTQETAKSLWENWEVYNCINENGSHPCYYVVPAIDQSNLLYGHKYYEGYGYYFDENSYSYEDLIFPGTGNVTTYTPVDWNGNESELSFADIAFTAGRVKLRVVVPTADLDYPAIDNPGNGVYASGSRFDFNLLDSPSRTAQSVAWYFDDEPIQADSVNLTTGHHTVEARVILTTGNTLVVTLEIDAN